MTERQRGDVDVAAANKKRVISYIKAELSYDLDAIKIKRGAGAVLDFAIQKTPLKSDFWKIAGLSGDLKWIDDVELLNLIADAISMSITSAPGKRAFSMPPLEQV